MSELATLLAESWARLAEGAANPGSAWRNMAFATTGLNGMPHARTVVLRRIDAEVPWLEVHTDSRSAKHAELVANPSATLHGWDPAARIQLRACGTVALHQADAVAASAWAALSLASRGTYRVALPPGTAIAAPEALPAATDDTAAQSVFCVARLHVRALEYLHLRQGSHRRARFVWDDAGRTAMWLVP